MKEHLKELDFLRSIATLAVIAIHVTAGYLQNGAAVNYFSAYLGNQVARFAVPIFIIVSGYLLFYYNLEQKDVLFKKFITRRFSKIIVPYLIWTLFYSVYFLHDGLLELKYGIVEVFGQGFNFWENYLVHIVQGTAAPHLYFIVIILQLYVLYPLLHRLIRINEKLVLVSSFMVTFYFQLADYLYVYDYLLLPESGFKYYSILFFPWLFYFVLGMYTVAKIKKGGLMLNQAKVELSLLWVLAYFILIMDTKLSVTLGTSLKPTIMLYSIVSFYFLYSLGIFIKNYHHLLDQFIRWFSTQSFLIYFVHILVLTEIRILAVNNSFDMIWSSLGVITLYISVVIISCLSVFILSLLPFVKVIGGVYSKGGMKYAADQAGTSK